MTDYHSTMPSTAATSHSARFVTDIITPLKDRVALLPGSRDRHKHPIIFFPTTDISANSDELKNILYYFYSVTADDAKLHGFIFIIGTKKGTSRQSVKPSSILQLIHEYFPGKVITVYIIKENTFFKMSSTSGKYKFHVQEIPEENLTKFIDSSQLLKEFGGNLHYDHDEWIEIRKDIEFVIQKLSGCLKECEICYKLLQKKKMIEDNGQDWPLNAQDEFDRRLNSISTIDCDNDIRRIREQILKTTDSRYNSNTVKTPNPDLSAVVPNLQRLAKQIAKERSDLTGSYQRSKLEQDQWNQYRLLENEVIELKNRIINQKVAVDETFTVIGNNELEAQQLLKEHQRLEDAVEQTKVNYTHLLKNGSIQINNFPAKKNEIDAILKDLENSWNYLTALIDQRLKLLDIVISFRQETEVYFSRLPEWMNFIRAQPDNLDKPLTELEDITKRQEEVENEIELSYSRSYDESMKLSQRLVMYLGQERAGKDESYRHVLEVIQKLTRSRREMHALYEEKRIKLAMKMSFTAFVEESASVINWIDAHGLPHMKKKTTIGRSSAEIKNLHLHHHKFKSVAENTKKNAIQLYQVAEKLSENANGETEVVKDRLQQLSNVVQNFFNLMDHREQLLTQSAMFHLHYNEITDWYENIKDRSKLYEIVPPNQEDCENLKDQLIKENEATAQAYATVIEESDKLIRMLKAQKEMLDVDVSKDEAHIEEMTNSIQTKHSREMDRWPYQRNCVQIGYISREFVTEISTICKQIIEYRKELVPLQAPSQRNERVLYEFLKVTDENIKQIEDVFKDFAQRYSELIQMIETHQLNLIDNTKKPMNEILTQKFQQLNHIVDETLIRANTLKQELSINQNIRETFARTEGVVNEIKKETDALNMLMVRIPETKDEARKLGLRFEELRPRVDQLYPMFNEMKEIFRYLAMNSNDNQKRNIMITNDKLMRSWENYLAKTKDCQKLVTQAINYHNMNEILTPTIDQILNNPITHPHDYCQDSKIDLVSYLSSLQTKHASDKEKFLKATIHSRKINDDFIRIIQKCPIKKEYRILKERDIRQQMEFNERRQKDVLKLINDRTKYIEQCQRAVFVRKMAEDVQTWLKSDAAVRKFYEDYKNLRSLPDDLLQEKHAHFLEFKNKAKKKQHEVKEINRHAELYHHDGINIVHSKEVQECQHTVTECFKTFWKHVEDMDKQFKILLGGAIERISPSDDSGVNDIAERFSDSTLEEKIQQTEDQKADIQMRKPMHELIKGEKDGIDYLRVIIDMYLPEYRKANKDGTLPASMVGKEKEIFGNIEELYQFHKHFVTELELYKNNPTDVGCAFVNNIQRIRDIYCEYTINKEKNGAIHHEAETVKFFTQILHKYSGNNNKQMHSHFDFGYYKEKTLNVNFDSVLMWPVQRLFKYSMLLNELIQFAPYEITEIKEVKDDIDGITAYANGIVKLADIKDFTVTSDDIFCMADEFAVVEPKRLFKSEKEYQVFLFETSIILTKKDKNEKNSVKYLFRDQIMLNDVFVVEHIGNSKIKFGLRKRNAASASDNTTVFTANNEKIQQQWVKKLREFTVSIQHHYDPNLSKKSSTTTLASDNYRASFRSPHSYSSSRPSSSTTDPPSNRNSRSSRDSCEIPHPNPSSNGHLTVPDNINGNLDINGSSAKDDHVGFRLSKWPKE